MNAVSRSSEDVVSEEMGQGSRIWQFTFVLSGARIGEECHVCSHCFIENDVVMGDRVTIKSKSGVQLWDGLRVGADVFIGPNATFTNDKHPRSRNTGFLRLTTVIKQSASMGEGALLLPGSGSEKTPWSRGTYPKHLRRRQSGPRDEQRSVMSETQPRFNIDKCRIVEMPKISKLLATSTSSKAGAVRFSAHVLPL